MPTAKVQPKMYEFAKASKKDFNAIEVDGKVLKMGKKKAAFTTHDPTLAHATKPRSAGQRGATGDLIMNTVDTHLRRVRFFVMPELPWKRKKE